MLLLWLRVCTVHWITEEIPKSRAKESKSPTSCFLLVSDPSMYEISRIIRFLISWYNVGGSNLADGLILWENCPQKSCGCDSELWVSKSSFLFRGQDQFLIFPGTSRQCFQVSFSTLKLKTNSDGIFGNWDRQRMDPSNCFQGELGALQAEQGLALPDSFTSLFPVPSPSPTVDSSSIYCRNQCDVLQLLSCMMISMN